MAAIGEMNAEVTVLFHAFLIQYFQYLFYLIKKYKDRFEGDKTNQFFNRKSIKCKNESLSNTKPPAFVYF